MKKKAQEKLAAKANPVPVEEVVVPEATATEVVVSEPTATDVVAEVPAEVATADVVVDTTDAAAE
ncbi:MAG: hypothetical protein NTV18_03790 [Actinobacteria bacterium]|nr:hypothetical protein [Actinomycetota bacterium]